MDIFLVATAFQLFVFRSSRKKGKTKMAAGWQDANSEPQALAVLRRMINMHYAIQITHH